ncbi:MAG TPA: hypothetical protein VLK22_01500 [Candidatus Udaeobacter sp.]|nr:hypothetical protein [Candidatus Udaeobacter sp.]
MFIKTDKAVLAKTILIRTTQRGDIPVNNARVDTRNIPDVFRAIARRFPAIPVSTAAGLEKLEIQRVNGATVITTMQITISHGSRLLCAVYSAHFFQGDQPFFTLTSHGKSHLQGRNADKQVWAARVRNDALLQVKNNHHDRFSLEHLVTHIVPVFGEREFYETIADESTAKAIRQQVRQAGQAKSSEAQATAS